MKRTQQRQNSSAGLLSRKTFLKELKERSLGVDGAFAPTKQQNQGSGCRYMRASDCLNRANEPHRPDLTGISAPPDASNPSPATYDLALTNESAGKTLMCHKCPTKTGGNRIL